MKKKKLILAALGGMMAMNIAWTAMPADSVAEAAPYHRSSRYERDAKTPEEAYRLAVREEKERHDREMFLIRHRHHGQPHEKRDQALEQERERHAKNMRDIENRYPHAKKD
ncbi:MAG: hypothetical protein IJS96_03195 [Schwartzia sp.]|nr:hypothetical protein [Schwartzia sp. (in: firmicutes)]